MDSSILLDTMETHAVDLGEGEGNRERKIRKL